MNFISLKALVRHAIRTGSLTWRHHGIGVLQAYVSENTNPEVRIHVWHPALVRPGILASGAIHDHRFFLRSTVLVGELREELFVPGPSLRQTIYDGKPGLPDFPQAPPPVAAGRYQVWNVENARSAGPEKGYDGACAPADDPAREYEVTERHWPQGSNYALERGIFHRTNVKGLAVTICEMYNKQGQARLLVPEGQEPVHAFGDYGVPEVPYIVLDEAEKALQ